MKISAIVVHIFLLLACVVSTSACDNAPSPHTIEGARPGSVYNIFSKEGVVSEIGCRAYLGTSKVFSNDGGKSIRGSFTAWSEYQKQQCQFATITMSGKALRVLVAESVKNFSEEAR
jgi:hypothetical protein